MSETLPPIQYALRRLHEGMFVADPHMVDSLEHAKPFSATSVLGRGTYLIDGRFEVVPFREYSRPTPPTREVVELEGDVCLKGLKFAVARRDLPLTGADYETIGQAARALYLGYRIVGIREVPGKVERVREIVE